MTVVSWKTAVLSLVFGVALSLTAAAVSAAEAPAQEYAGAYSGEVVWAGTVTMTGDVLILQGGRLTIRAGTLVRVVPAEGTKIDPEYLSSQTELLVRGSLDIQGSAAEPVRFLIHGDEAAEQIAWAGITLDRATESRIRHVALERADIGVRCVGSSPEITDSTIARCRYGIVAQQQSHPKIFGNTLTDGEGGVFCWWSSNPSLRDNRITGHDEEAVFVDASSRPRLDRNTISGNAVGLALYPRDLPYDARAVTGNAEDLRWLGHQGQGGDK